MSTFNALGNPTHLGRIAADRFENRTDNPFDRHELLSCYQEWDEAFVRRRKETSRSVVLIQFLSAPLHPKWEDM